MWCRVRSDMFPRLRRRRTYGVPEVLLSMYWDGVAISDPRRGRWSGRDMIINVG